jgi:hypothetical protein
MKTKYNLINSFSFINYMMQISFLYLLLGNFYLCLMNDFNVNYFKYIYCYVSRLFFFETYFLYIDLNFSNYYFIKDYYNDSITNHYYLNYH